MIEARHTRRGFALLLACAPLAALAKDHGEGHGHGHGHDDHDRDDHDRDDHEHGGPHGHGRPDVRPGAYFDVRHRDAARAAWVEHGHGHCPPGLAKKHNGCMPPGQVRRWVVGEPVPAGVAVAVVPQPVLVTLPPAPIGYRYVRLGGDVVLLRVQGGLVIDLVPGVFF